MLRPSGIPKIVSPGRMGLRCRRAASVVYEVQAYNARTRGTEHVGCFPIGHEAVLATRIAGQIHDTQDVARAARAASDKETNRGER